MTSYSQRDPRWKDIKINGTQYTLGTDGCLICCLSSIAGITPDVVVSKLRFSGANVDWSSIGNIGLELVQRDNLYDNDFVSSFIAANGSCIVRVDYDGYRETPSDTHFVLFIGNKQEIDPWTGTICPTSKYPLLTGYRAVKKVSTMTQVTLDSAKFEELVNKSSRYDEFVKVGYTSPAEIEKIINDLRAAIADKNLLIEVEEQRADEARKQLNDLIASCAKALNTVQEVTQINAALTKAEADLDMLDDLQRNFAELQLHSKKQVEDLNVEINRLQEIINSQRYLEGLNDYEFIRQILRDIVRRLKAFIK